MENQNNTEILKQINEKFGEAEKSKSTDFFKIHLSDDLIFLRANGDVNDKKKFLEELENPDKIYHEIRTDVQNILISENTKLAMVAALVYVRFTNKGTDTEGNFMNVRVFRMEGDERRVITWYNHKV